MANEMRYTYPGGLHNEIMKAMNANNPHSTDIDRHQEERTDPAFTKYFWRNLMLAFGIGFCCVLGIILILLNSEVIDKIKPEVQLIIFAVACFTFGLVRFVTWIRQTF